jgi:flavin reductase (DIM6/NTAB) family NADH-FMN oxidoreductase RutF
MLFDFATISPQDRFKLLASTVLPRPVAWIATLDRDGRLNAAPFSFFNAFAGEPPVVGIGMGSHEPGRPRDTRCNIRDTGQFVVNLVSEKMAESMNVTAIEFEFGTNELHEAGLQTVPSAQVRPPRISGCPVAMECELMQIVELGPDWALVLGRVLAMHVQDDFVIDAGKRHIDTPSLKLISHMHIHDGTWYARASDLFQMNRIPRKEWQGAGTKAE